MNAIQLSQIDLNLLITLQILLETESVAETGARLGRTPSAVSHALRRLRELLGDPLLVRAGQRLRCTPAALALRAPLHDALTAVAAVLQPTTFDPAIATGTVRIIATDYLQRVALIPVVERLRDTAPGLDLQILPITASVQTTLANGEADLALGVSLSAPEALRARTLGTDRFVTFAGSRHPASTDVVEWAARPHVLVAPGQKAGGPVDRALHALGLQRRVAVTVPNFLAAAELARRTDLVITLPERLARVLLPTGVPLHLPPVELEPIRLLVMWHPRTHASPLHQWLRRLMTEVVSSSEGAVPQSPAAQSSAFNERGKKARDI